MAASTDLQKKQQKYAGRMRNLVGSVGQIRIILNNVYFPGSFRETLQRELNLLEDTIKIAVKEEYEREKFKILNHRNYDKARRFIRHEI